MGAFLQVLPSQTRVPSHLSPPSPSPPQPQVVDGHQVFVVQRILDVRHRGPLSGVLSRLDRDSYFFVFGTWPHLHNSTLREIGPCSFPVTCVCVPPWLWFPAPGLIITHVRHLQYLSSITGFRLLLYQPLFPTTLKIVPERGKNWSPRRKKKSYLPNVGQTS